MTAPHTLQCGRSLAARRVIAPPIQFVVNGKFLGARPTGVHRVARELLDGLDKMLAGQPHLRLRYDFVVAVPRNVRALPGFQCFAVKRVGLLTGQPWEQISLPCFAGRRRLLNLCNLAPIAKPGIVMIHDAQVRITPASYPKAFALYYRLMQPLIGARAELVLTVSDYSRRMLDNYGIAPMEKIMVVPNGGDHAGRVAADLGVLREQGLKPRRYAVALATTQKHKNIPLLLRAFRDARLEAIQLVLVGGAKAQDFAALGMRPPPNVIFAGTVSDGELRGLLEQAACLAFPSTTEGFGLPPVEAMTLGCPVVATRCGAIPAICDDGAIYAPADNPAAWAEAIVQLATDANLRSDLVARGRLRASQFTWARSTEALMRALEILAIASARGPLLPKPASRIGREEDAQTARQETSGR